MRASLASLLPCLAIAACDSGGGDPIVLETAVLPVRPLRFDFDGRLLVCGGEGFDLLAYDAADGVLHDLPSNILPGKVLTRGSRGAYRIAEGFDGIDLNGDGDVDDAIPVLVDETGAWRTLDIAALELWMSDRVLAFCVSEVFEGRDIDGNGCANDLWGYVQHLGEPGPERLELSVEPGMHAEGDFVAMGAIEALSLQDLNGDGDTGDSVLHLYHVPTRTIESTERSVFGPRDARIVGSRVAFPSFEADDGEDVNGDGEQDDIVLSLYDFEQAELHVTDLRGEDWRFDGRFLTSAEEERDFDLNGDGDQLDVVLRVYDVETRDVRILGSWVPSLHRLVEGRVFFPELEEAAREDLDGDGLIRDRFHLVDLVSGDERVLNHDPVGGSALSRTHAAFYAQGSDGSPYLLAHEIATGREVRIAGLPNPSFAMHLSERAMIFSVRELDLDLDGDGQIFGEVLHVYDFRRGRTINLGLRGSPIGVILAEDRFAFAATDEATGEFVLHVSEL